MITLTDAQRKVADQIAAIAAKFGVDSRLAVADAYKESKLDPNAKGDYVNGVPTSFGVFQLHRGGELGSLTPEQAYDVNTNATTALTVFDSLNEKYSGGTLAAKAQRPASPDQYATDVNSLIATGAFDDWFNNGGKASTGTDGGITNGNWSQTSGAPTVDSSNNIKLFSTPLGDVNVGKSGTVRVFVVVMGFALVVIALHALTSNATSPIGVVSNGASNAATNAKNHVKKTGTAAAAATVAGA